MLPFYSTLLTSYTYKTKLNAPPRFVLSLQESGKLYANTEYTTEKIGVIQTTCTELERFDKSEWRAEFPFALVKMSCSTQGKDLNSTSTTCYVDGLGVFVDFCDENGSFEAKISDVVAHSNNNEIVVLYKRTYKNGSLSDERWSFRFLS